MIEFIKSEIKVRSEWQICLIEPDPQRHITVITEDGTRLILVDLWRRAEGGGLRYKAQTMDDLEEYDGDRMLGAISRKQERRNKALENSF